MFSKRLHQEEVLIMSGQDELPRGSWQSLFPAASLPDQKAQEPRGHGGKDEHRTWAQPRGRNLTKAESCQALSLPEAAINVSLPTSSHSTGTWASGGGWINYIRPLSLQRRHSFHWNGPLFRIPLCVSSMPATFLPATSSTDLLKASFTVTASEQETHFTK